MEFYWDLRILFFKLHLSNDYLFSFLSGALSKKECWLVLSPLSRGRASDSRLFPPWIDPFVRLIFTAGAPDNSYLFLLVHRGDISGDSSFTYGPHGVDTQPGRLGDLASSWAADLRCSVMWIRNELLSTSWTMVCSQHFLHNITSKGRL